MPKLNINNIRHPLYLACQGDWRKWRETYKAGDDFVNRYLEKFSKREDAEDFRIRKAMTPIPSFAKAAIQDIRSSLFQRMSDVSRIGGSLAFQKAVAGELTGVDNRGRGMTSYLGTEVLEDLLVIGKVGVYVDAPSTSPNSVYSSDQFKPYCYSFRAEDILSWKKSDPEHPSEFESVLLRESCEEYDDQLGLPCGTKSRLRYAWINQATKLVNIQYFDTEGEPMANPVELGLTRIPFVVFDINGSLMQDIANHQIALLNLWSSNVIYGVQGSFPVYVEQRDSRDVGSHLKRAANVDGTATAGGQGAADESIEIGVMKGRFYDLGAEKPGFINPDSEPLKANLELCNTLKENIRELCNLSLTNLGTQVSAESRAMESQGLESGLSFIGLVLEAGKREIASHWASYEDSVEEKRNVAKIAYPERWSLKTNEQRIKEAQDLHTASSKLPGQTVKKETSKILVSALLGHRVNQEVIEKIHAEIEAAKYTTSDPEVIRMASETGLVSAETATMALGFNKDEADKAQTDHVKRLKEITEAQAPKKPIQGVPDTSANPAADNKKDPTALKRGEGKAI